MPRLQLHQHLGEGLNLLLLLEFYINCLSGQNIHGRVLQQVQQEPGQHGQPGGGAD